MPATYGAELAAAKEPPRRFTRRWDAASVLEAAEQISEAAESAFVQGMLRHAREHGAQVRGGSGEFPSAGFYYQVADERRSVWSLWLRDSGPVVAVNLGSVRTSSEDAAWRMLQQIQGAECFRAKLGDNRDLWLTKFPAVPVAEMLAQTGVDTAVMRALDEAIGATELTAPGAAPASE